MVCDACKPRQRLDSRLRYTENILRVMLAYAVVISHGCFVGQEQVHDVALVYEPVLMENERNSASWQDALADIGEESSQDVIQNAWTLAEAMEYDRSAREFDHFLLVSDVDTLSPSGKKLVLRRCGISYLMSGREVEAVAAFSSVLAIDGNDADSLFHRMQTYRSMGNVEAANEDAQRGSKLGDPLFNETFALPGQGGMI